MYHLIDIRYVVNPSGGIVVAVGRCFAEKNGRFSCTHSLLNETL